MWINTKWYIVDDIFDTIEFKTIKNYDDINSTTTKECWCRNNYQVKSGTMHLDKCKAYLTCNLGTRRCHTYIIEYCYLTKLIWKYPMGSKSKAYTSFWKTCLSSS